MYIRLGTVSLPGQFPRLREEWEGLRIEGLKMRLRLRMRFAHSYGRFKILLASCGVATSLPNSFAILTTRSTSSALFLARTPFE